MTTFDRFDPFERRIGNALEAIEPMQSLPYLDHVFQQTARTRQRPRWSFIERWFTVDTTVARPMFGQRVPIRTLLLLALIAAMVASAAFYFGTRKRLPLPYGPADNGVLVYGFNGDLYARDTVLGGPRLLISAPGNQSGVVLSPDGQLISYDSFSASDPSADPYEWVANLDGSNPRQVLDRPYTFDSFEWAPDSRSIAIITSPTGARSSGSHRRTARAPGS